MPELPEVHTTVRGISSIKSKYISRIWSDWDKTLSFANERGSSVLLKKSSAHVYARILRNRKVLEIERRGKYILIRLSGEYALLIHQKMTGHLLLGKWKMRQGIMEPDLKNKSFLHEKVNSYIHFLITFRDGTMLGLSDVRKFAKIILGKEDAVFHIPALVALGPDPTLKNFDTKILAERLAKHSPIKKLLLDQTVIAGIGNIYSDEILFRARIHPLRAASDAARESATLLRVMRNVLSEGIRLGGASKTNYRNPKGERGGFMETCLVYGRAGLPCVICKTRIEKIKVGGRTASFCPKCQQ